MVDSILTNQAPVVQQVPNNRSITGSAVSNASSIPEVELADQVVDVSPRTMDADSDNGFASPVPLELRPAITNVITDGADLRPPLENFRPIEITSERALENRIADIEIRGNDTIDETDSQVSVNNSAIEAFVTEDQEIQQIVDLTA
jgi:hypothetical protein|tara:strand:- start:99 stop:536 length:438 start_codon:yes stop_codon:yes gene_type:complete